MPRGEAIFRRHWTLTIGNSEFSSNQDIINPLDLRFDIEKTNRREPNTAVIEIYNLGDERKGSISKEDPVSLVVGYQGGLADSIFLGDIKEVSTEWKGTDRITKIKCEDAGNAYSDARVSLQFPAGTTVLAVVRRLLKEMNVGEGNVSGLNQGFERRNRPIDFETGFSCRGRAWRTLNNLIRSAGFNWSIQDGNIQIRRGNNPIQEDKTIVLSPESGLLDRTTSDIDSKTSEKTIKITALPVKGFYIGRVIELRSREVNGFFQIKRVNYSGETFSALWQVEIELSEARSVR